MWAHWKRAAWVRAARLTPATVPPRISLVKDIASHDVICPVIDQVEVDIAAWGPIVPHVCVGGIVARCRGELPQDLF